MSTIRVLKFTTAVDTKGFDNGLRSLENSASRSGSKIGNSLQAKPGIGPTPSSIGPGSSGIGDPAGMAADFGSSVLPLAGQIRTALVSAMAPLNSFAARFSAQFDIVGRTLVNAAVKADQNFRFPRFQQAITGARKLVIDAFGDMQGRVGQFARGADKTLGAVQFGSKIKFAFDQLHSVKSGDLGKLSKINLPSFSSSFDSSTKSITNLYGATDVAARSFKNLGVQVGLSLGAFGLVFKGVEFIKGGITGAAQFGDTLSKTKVIFGDSSKTIIDESDRMAEAFGVSKNEYVTAAGNFGAVFKGIGKSQDEAAGLGNQLAKLGMDMASFEGVANGEAFTAISAALRGEMDPIERFRVFLTADAVAAEALAMGLSKGKGPLDENAKKMATLSLITKQTADANGDLERTGGETGNQMKKFTGSISNLATSVGMMLMPAFDAFLGIGNSVLSFFGDGLGTVAPYVTSFAQFVAYSFDSIGRAVMFIIDPVILIGQELVASFGESMGSLSGFGQAFQSTVEFARVWYASIAVFVVDLGERLLSLPAMVAETFGPGAMVSVGNFATAVGAWLVGAFDTVAFTVRNFGDILSYAFVSATVHVMTFWDNLRSFATFFADNWVQVMTMGIFTVSNTLFELGRSIVNFITNPTAGFQFDLSEAIKPTTDVIAKLPEFKSADLSNSPELKEIGDRIAEREANFSKTLEGGFKLAEFKQLDPAATGSAAAPKTDTPEKKDAGLATVKFAGAAKLGSTDAYKSLSMAFAGKTGGGADSVEKNTKDAVKEQRRTNKKLDRVAKAVENNTLQVGVLKA